MPAAIVQGHRREHAERKMYGGVTAGRRQHHVMLALFDAATGVRIDDAAVTSKVGEPGLAIDKRLEPMPIAGAMSYGNYFALPPPGPYQIDLRIMRPGSARPIATTSTCTPAR